MNAWVGKGGGGGDSGNLDQLIHSPLVTGRLEGVSHYFNWRPTTTCSPATERSYLSPSLFESNFDIKVSEFRKKVLVAIYILIIHVFYKKLHAFVFHHLMFVHCAQKSNIANILHVPSITTLQADVT
jgi:hypothetical protein